MQTNTEKGWLSTTAAVAIVVSALTWLLLRFVPIAAIVMSGGVLVTSVIAYWRTRDRTWLWIGGINAVFLIWAISNAWMFPAHVTDTITDQRF